jgi:serine/threonine protein kinase
MGSAHYMAPEQLTNHYAQSSDTYSLGVIALELLTGKRPSEFSQSPDSPGFSEELAAAIFPILGRPSSRLVQMLASALVANPRSRPESIATWASQLAAALES